MKTLNEVRDFFANDRFATDNGAVIEEVGENSATVSMTIEDHHRNAVGIVMGGAIFTLADFAFAVASNHENPGTVSLSANITFLKASKGSKLIAKAECVRDGRIERTQDNLAKLRLDHAEAQKIVAEPFPQQEELDTKEQRLKVVTDELNQAAIEAKKNAPKREKTCYFERAKMKRDAARLGKKPKTPKDQTKGRSKKQGIE